MGHEIANIASVADAFIQALQRAEQSRDVEPLVRLFNADAEASGLARTTPCCGLDAVRTFWQEYLAAFETVRSTFTHIKTGVDSAALEWRSDGTLPGGQPISYVGVSLLEFRDSQVTRFRTYYDSAAFLPDGAKLLGRKVEA